MQFDCIVRGGTVVFPNHGERVVDIAITGGKFRRSCFLGRRYQPERLWTRRKHVSPA